MAGSALRAIVWAGLAACGGGSAPAPDAGSAAAPDVNGLDLVITPQFGVTAYVGFTTDWGGGPPEFPQPGACGTGEQDGEGTGPTCFDHISVGGSALAPENPSGPANPFSGALSATDPSFELADCGVVVGFPLHPGGYPALSNVQAAQGSNSVTVSWTTDGASTIAALANGYYDIECHEVGATQHVFDGAGLGIEVEAFRAPEVTQTALGEIRVWYGTAVRMPLPVP